MLIPQMISPLHAMSAPMPSYEAFGRLFERYGGAPVVANKKSPEREDGALQFVKDQGYSLELDLPGLDPSEIEIRVDEDAVEIRATRGSEAPQGYRVVRGEGRSYQYRRRYALANRIDVAQAEAVLENGLLHLKMPLIARTETRVLEISSPTSDTSERE